MTREQLHLSNERLALLTRDTWKARLGDLLHDCAASAPTEQADRIREARDLLRQGAAQVGRLPAAIPDLELLDAMLALGAHESAVLALIGSDSVFMLSRGANGNCLASAVLPDGSEEMVAEGSTLALALLCAYLSSLLADSEQDPYEAVHFHPIAGTWLN